MKVEKFLRSLGIKIHYKGFEYLTTAIEMCLDDKGFLHKTMKVYEEIALANDNANVSKVERCIRNAIQECDFNKLGFKTKPSNKEFIAACVFNLKNNIELKEEK